MDTFTIFPDDNLVIYKAEPHFETEAVLEYLIAFMAHPDFRPGMKEVVDLSGVSTWDMDYHELRSISEFNRCNNKTRHQVERLVILAPNELAFGYARMYDSLSNDFRKISIVRKWEELPQALDMSLDTLVKCYDSLQPLLFKSAG